MLNKSQIAELRKLLVTDDGEILQSDAAHFTWNYATDLLDTLEALWKVAEAAKKQYEISYMQACELESIKTDMMVYGSRPVFITSSEKSFDDTRRIWRDFLDLKEALAALDGKAAKEQEEKCGWCGKSPRMEGSRYCSESCRDAAGCWAEREAGR